MEEIPTKKNILQSLIDLGVITAEDVSRQQARHSDAIAMKARDEQVKKAAEAKAAHKKVQPQKAPEKPSPPSKPPQRKRSDRTGEQDSSDSSVVIISLAESIMNKPTISFFI